MSNITIDEDNIASPSRRTRTKIATTSESIQLSGKIQETIGTGDNAKNSIVYLTIKWAFISASVLSGFIVLNSWFFRENEKVPNFTDDIQTVWKIVIPIITLALGYAFGRHESKAK